MSTGGFNVRPRHFECDITVRSPQHEATLKREYEEVAMKIVQQYPLFPEEEGAAEK